MSKNKFEIKTDLKQVSSEVFLGNKSPVHSRSDSTCLYGYISSTSDDQWFKVGAKWNEFQRAFES